MKHSRYIIEPQRSLADSELEAIQALLKDAVPKNTHAAMKSMVVDFERNWHGMLPTTTEMVLAYISARSDKHKISTIETRVAMISRWHTLRDFPDPTKHKSVSAALKGARKKDTKRPKQARAASIDDVRAICAHLDAAKIGAIRRHDYIEAMRCARDRALLLVGFWKGYRSDEICSMRMEAIQIDRAEGMRIWLPHTKTDSKGKTQTVPYLHDLCPVKAFEYWRDESGRTEGPAFMAISAQGKLSTSALTPRSFRNILRGLYVDAGLDPEGISSHSLRRGFAHWATNEGWSQSSLMAYVGWSDVRSAIKYMPDEHSFGRFAVKGGDQSRRLQHDSDVCLPSADVETEDD